ncbi:MAG TPA: rhomboid family intramembrane serine protease [archaeon]|nr:rhomboid family intramembrane serine protease [archaeon]
MNSKGQFYPLKDYNKSKSFPIITLILIALNALIFYLSTLIGLNDTILRYGFIPGFFSLETFYTIITSTFLHADLAHLTGNMWFLWIFGDNVEDKLGKKRFTALYLISGLTANLALYLINPSWLGAAIGASGAISGVMGAYFILFNQKKIKTKTGIKSVFIFMGAYFAFQLYYIYLRAIGELESNTAFLAHIAGFIAGIILLLILFKGKISFSIKDSELEEIISMLLGKEKTKKK